MWVVVKDGLYYMGASQWSSKFYNALPMDYDTAKAVCSECNGTLVFRYDVTHYSFCR